MKVFNFTLVSNYTNEQVELEKRFSIWDKKTGDLSPAKSKKRRSKLVTGPLLCLLSFPATSHTGHAFTWGQGEESFSLLSPQTRSAHIIFQSRGLSLQGMPQ